MKAAIDLFDDLVKGVCFRHRADRISRSQRSPPDHGAVSYCETGLVWEKRDLGDLGMFRYFVDST